MAVSMHGLSGGGFGSWRFIVPAFIILGIILGAVVWGASNSNGADRIQPDYSSTPLAYGSPSNGNAKPSYNPTFGLQNPPPGDAFGTPSAQTPSSPSALPLPNSGQPPTGSAPAPPFLGTPPPPAGPSDPNAVNQPSAWPNPLAGQPFGTPPQQPNGQPNTKYQQLEQELNRQSTVYQTYQTTTGAGGKTAAIQPGTRVAAVVPQAVPGAPGVPVYAVLSQGVPGIAGFGPGSKAVGTVVVAQGNRVYINFKVLINNIGAQLPVAAVAVEARDGNVGVQGSQAGGRKWMQAVERVASQALPLFGKNAPTTIINNGGGGQQTPAQPPNNALIFQGGNIVVQFVADGALPPDPNTPSGQNPSTGAPQQPQGNPGQPSAPNGFQPPPAGQNGQPVAGWPQQPPPQGQPNQPHPPQYPNGQYPPPQQYPPQN